MASGINVLTEADWTTRNSEVFLVEYFFKQLIKLYFFKIINRYNILLRIKCNESLLKIKKKLFYFENVQNIGINLILNFII